jgi:3-dehydroquinate dehydratase-2
MHKILIINGPNLNKISLRESDHYGNTSIDEINNNIKKLYKNIDFEFFQSNNEGEIISKLQEFNGIGIVINPAAYGHTSIGILDALKIARNINNSHFTIIEVHLSNIYKREKFRHKTFTSIEVDGVISGLGSKGYEYAVDFIIDKNNN